jgi:hypothetical protein
MNETDERPATVVNNTYPAERAQSPLVRHSSTVVTMIFIVACGIGAFALLVLALGLANRAIGWAF